MLDILITISPIIPIASLKASEVKTAPSAAVLPYKYKCEDTAKRLLNYIGCINDRLIDNPYQFPLIRDRYLSMKGYRIAIIPKTKYILVFDIREDTVFVLGIFHQLENYWIKV